MPLGYCMECCRLKPIVKVGLHILSREADWAPVEHEALCSGTGFDIGEDADVVAIECPKCDSWWETCDLEGGSIPEHVPAFDGTKTRPPSCPGSRKVIR